MKRLYRLMMLIAGRYAPQFRHTLGYVLAAVVVQVMSYAVLVPLFYIMCTPTVPLEQLWPWLGLYALLVVAEAMLRLKSMGFTWHCWHRVIGDTRLRLGKALYDMPLLTLRRYDAGELADTIGGNVNVAASALSSLATLFVQMVTLPALMIVLMLLIDWRLGLAFSVAGGLMLPLIRRVQRLYQRDSLRVDAADAASAAQIVEYVSGLAVFKATGQAGADSPRLSAVFAHQHDAQQEGSHSAAYYVSLCQLIVQLALIAMIAVGGMLVAHERLNVATLAALLVIAVHLIEPLGIIATMSKLFEMAEVALSRINALLKVAPLPCGLGASMPEDVTIKLKNVSFGYRPDQPLLHNVSLTLPEHKITALVGPSGAGKTTITQLINRFADPLSGSITLGGVDIRTFTPQQLAHAISVVYQDVWLFDDTIRANLLCGRPSATEQEMRDAAKAANIHDVVNALPQGYDTAVGEVGAMLSGGERQRLSIARAILKDAPIVLLDEPTASLDSESEFAVQQAIDALVTGRTVVIVAHRLTTVVGADQIAVIDEGHIVECGTHRALIASGGRYARMWQAQSGHGRRG
ncbi:ABC transporter ATP-binding protein [Zymobacter sp. IVIA_5232.4 C2]|uniref:ABC transporter ATP-binding protein n=1 Tax=Zymobacter sp. IVIA_5232.4 C2 TaxID=3394855 RepID=UPI0039C2E93C